MLAWLAVPPSKFVPSCYPYVFNGGHVVVQGSLGTSRKESQVLRYPACFCQGCVRKGWVVGGAALIVVLIEGPRVRDGGRGDDL